MKKEIVEAAEKAHRAGIKRGDMIFDIVRIRLAIGEDPDYTKVDYPFNLIMDLAFKYGDDITGVDFEIVNCAVHYYDAKDMGDKYIMGEERKKLEKILGR